MIDIIENYRKSLEEWGCKGSPILFLFYLFMWTLGWVFGLLLILLGMEFEEEEISEEEYESLLREEIEEKIRIMNEQGPNN